MACVFCKIIDKSIPADIVREDEDVLALKDIHPIAPVHILIVPKKHIASIVDLTPDNQALMGKMIFTAKEIAKDLQIDKNGYKLLFRVGNYGGQEVDHIHLHLIGGAKLYEDIHPVQ